MPEIDSDATPAYPPPRGGLPRALRPFRLGQYRLLAGALTLSLLGAGMWIVAVVWQVIELGGGPAELSFVAAGNAAGMLVAVLFGGVLADRVPQRNILLAVEATKTVSIATAAVLALSGTLELWHLVIVTTILGLADGFFYPAYSALLPAILPAEDLLAANGVEGMLRPTIMQAAGPALASAAIAAFSPGLAFAFVAAAQALAVGGLLLIRSTPVRREIGKPQHPLRALSSDLREGFVYMWRTPWLLGTLLYACLLVFVIMGPIEVLLPFAVRDQTGGGPGAFALVLAAFGVGGALGSLVVASLTLPRRYLTIMNLLWGAGCIPLAVIGTTSQLWLMVVALFLVGFTFSAATVIWGTLLQRRVPPALLGRVSSLDFFVSLALMPISMAVAGPVGEAIGLAPAFLAAGAIPFVLAVATILLFKLPEDEILHPLDPAGEPAVDIETDAVSSDSGDGIRRDAGSE
ncbi:MFS transporter [Mycetocola miduiensis]|uniref:Predicted arabinose efflux permease, MFS family n=1 Tax=Mycetocola miduiensis TaxID=995034 RepID=A0A1I5BJY6_9MICO|nr:MFS transporter [Mycetocola miduiensis]SFN74970.1 Predicted arabinose efflux permease, MFS family [Mycetocola miduiensis]